MRSSDWSSDVVSADLLAAEHQRGVGAQPDRTVEMPLGKGERARVAHEQGELAMTPDRLGHLGRRRGVGVVDRLRHLHDRMAAMGAEEVEAKSLMLGPKTGRAPDRKRVGR